MGFFSDKRKAVLTEGATRMGGGYQPEDKPEFTVNTPMPSCQPPRPRPPAPPMPEPTCQMTNAELAEAIEYARGTIEKVKDPGLQKRLVQQVEKLLDVQLARASAVAIDTQAKTVP